MTAYCIDSSALVKRYVNEIGSSWMRTLCDPAAGHILAVAHVGLVEVAAALGTKHRPNVLQTSIYDGLLRDLWRDGRDQYWLIEVNQEIVRSAIELTRRQKLRGYDAVHLACALLVQRTLLDRDLPLPVLLSADGDLLEAAQNEGMVVADPNAHP